MGTRRRAGNDDSRFGRDEMGVSQQKVLGRLGMNFVERVALEAGCKPIEISEDLDTGIDGFLEFPGAETNLVAFQVKRGNSFFDDRGPKHQTDPRHLRYWKGYPVPVILVIVRADESEACWMDVRQHIRGFPHLVEEGPFVLRPPRTQRFEPASLRNEIRALAPHFEFGDAVSALTDPDVGTRHSAVSSLYPFRMERRAAFCLAAAMRFETDLHVLQYLCDFLSRYLPHPETTFITGGPFRDYAESLLSDIPRQQLLNVLAAFNDSEEYGDWDGATEIYSMDDEGIWDRHAVVYRGTVQQGIAEVVRVAASPAQLLSVVADSEVPLGNRRAAVALFGYLGYTCPTKSVDEIMERATDAPLRALLTWLRYWLIEEGRGA